METNASDTFTAVILAGDRGPNDPLVQETGANCKALVKIAGTPMLLRVIQALTAATQIGHCVLSGPQQAQRGAAIDGLVESGAVTWLEPQSTPSTSALMASQAVEPKQPILLTSADHALLTSEIVDEFCIGSRARYLDVAVGLCPFETIETAFPGIRKTVLRFRDGQYCGCNLFAFLTPRGREIANEWRQVEKDRKSPIKVIRILGWWSVVRYFLGWLTLNEALSLLSKKLNLRIGSVLIKHPEAAIDVDSPADLVFVEKILSAVAP